MDVVSPGYLGETEEKTGEFEFIDFCAPSLSSEVAPVLREPWPDYELVMVEPDSVEQTKQ